MHNLKVYTHVIIIVIISGVQVTDINIFTSCHEKKFYMKFHISHKKKYYMKLMCVDMAYGGLFQTTFPAHVIIYRP